jgi:octopine/nopaline transport system substrate-binding protein
MLCSVRMSSGRLAAVAAFSIVLAGPVGAAAEITFATEGDYPPWNERQADGTFAGFDIDVVNALCKTLGETCDFVTDAFPGMINALADNDYDAIISGIAITDEREETIDFTRPYMSYAASFATAAGSPLAGQASAASDDLLKSLAGMRIGAQEATVNARLIESLVPDATLVTFGNQEALNQAVADGAVDAALAGTQVWKNPAPVAASAVVVVGSPFTSAEYPLLGHGLGIGVSKTNPSLKEWLDEAICDLTGDGTIADLSKKWFGDDLSVPCE